MQAVDGEKFDVLCQHLHALQHSHSREGSKPVLGIRNVNTAAHRLTTIPRTHAAWLEISTFGSDSTSTPRRVSQCTISSTEFENKLIALSGPGGPT